MLKSFMLASAASALALSAGAVAQTVTPTTELPAATALPTSEPSTTETTAETETTVETPVADATVTTDTTATTPAPVPSTPDAATAATDPSATTTAGPAATTASAAPVTAPAGTIAAAVGANADLSTLGSALTAAELTATLGQPGPFTVFAPTNEAFNLIPAATRTQLMDPANKASLATILQFHVVPGNITSAQLREQITAGGGTANLQTVAGQTLRASLEGEQIVLSGENNSKAYIASADNASSNGTVHVVNGILVPRLG